jgi:hypothetical protein
VSPILTRPIREQLEHDRIIRQLQARYKRKHDVAINPGMEQNQSVMVGDLAVFPDLLLFSLERGRRLEGTVEVETGESVNQLEALAEWGVFSKLKAPFYLYVPPQSIESARRICDEHQFAVAEIWTYHLSLDQVRFTQVWRSPNAPKLPASKGDRPAEEPAAKVAARKPAKPAVAAKPAAARTQPVATANKTAATNGKGANKAKPAPAKASAGKAGPSKAAPAKSASNKTAKAARSANGKSAKAGKPNKPSKANARAGAASKRTPAKTRR